MCAYINVSIWLQIFKMILAYHLVKIDALCEFHDRSPQILPKKKQITIP
jgi:hypothetical protein